MWKYCFRSSRYVVEVVQQVLIQDVEEQMELVV